MPAHLKIDFVSDVVCPWCAIGLAGVRKGLAALGDEVQADLHFQPFELNPGMGPQGQDILEHLSQKYGSTEEQMKAAQENIRQRGAALGFVFNMDKRGRIVNTFDAHRLLHWAGEVDASGEMQLALKQALLSAYFTEGQDPSSHEVLQRVAAGVGMDAQEAAQVLASDRYAAEVRERQRFYQTHGINSVPTIIINDRHLISGGQPPEVFAQAFRQIAQEQAS